MSCKSSQSREQRARPQLENQMPRGLGVRDRRDPIRISFEGAQEGSATLTMFRATKGMEAFPLSRRSPNELLGEAS